MEHLELIIPGLVAIFGWVYQTYTNDIIHRRNRELEIQKTKLPVYEEFLEVLLEYLLMLGEAKENNPKPKNKLVKFSAKAFVWFSDDMLKAYLMIRSFHPKKDPDGYLRKLEEIFLLIREEVGYENKGFDGTLFVSMFATDWMVKNHT